MSYTADNSDITQSHARETRHSRMQLVNNLCTDSKPLPAEYCIVGIPHCYPVCSWKYLQARQNAYVEQSQQGFESAYGWPLKQADVPVI